jgi:four helix bundle protein
MSKSIIGEKSFAFATRVVRLCRQLHRSQKEFVLSTQLMRSGTSIGANVEEAIGGQSKRDFLANMSIALKEARETRYWLRLVRDSDAKEHRLTDSLLNECEEILRILNSIVLTTRQKVSRKSRNSSADGLDSTLTTPHFTLNSTLHTLHSSLSDHIASRKLPEGRMP